MLSKAKIKLINSLSIKKYRKNHGLFVVQGTKGVLELIGTSYHIEELFCTEQFQESHKGLLNGINPVITDEKSLTKAGSFSNSEDALALVRIPEKISLNGLKSAIILDGVRDPGNLGTIIRIADWYGVKQLLCSQDSADVYSPKVISSSMGSFGRITVDYGEVSEFIKSSSLKSYGCVLQGTSIYEFKGTGEEINLVMGSESHGVSSVVESLCHELITIPRVGQAESLNVGVATGIICDNIFRKA